MHLSAVSGVTLNVRGSRLCLAFLRHSREVTHYGVHTITSNVELQFYDGQDFWLFQKRLSSGRAASGKTQNLRPRKLNVNPTTEARDFASHGALPIAHKSRVVP